MNKQELEANGDVEMVLGVDDTIDTEGLLQRVEEGEKKKIIEGLIKCLYTDFNDYVESFEDSKDLFEKNGIDFEELKNEVASNLNEIMRHSVDTIKDDVNIDYGDCVIDIVRNINVEVFGFLNLLKKRGRLDSGEDRDVEIWGCANKRIQELKDYVNIVNTDKKVLEDELDEKYGYLDQFTPFFKEKETKNRGVAIHLMPTGLSRIKYISFFNKLDKFKDKQEFEEALNELPDTFVNKEKVRDSVEFAE